MQSTDIHRWLRSCQTHHLATTATAHKPHSKSSPSSRRPGIPGARMLRVMIPMTPKKPSAEEIFRWGVQEEEWEWQSDGAKHGFLCRQHQRRSLGSAIQRVHRRQLHHQKEGPPPSRRCFRCQSRLIPAPPFLDLSPLTGFPLIMRIALQVWVGSRISWSLCGGWAWSRVSSLPFHFCLWLLRTAQFGFRIVGVS